jgi:hypothetical protein
VPDNYDSFDEYEKENARRKRLQKKLEFEEDFKIDELPFYYIEDADKHLDED